jgi:hypothetical protein
MTWRFGSRQSILALPSMLLGLLLGTVVGPPIAAAQTDD